MIAFRSVFIEEEKFDLASFWPRDVIQVIDLDLDLTDSQELRLARNVKAIHDGAWQCPKLEAIRDVWRLYDDEAPPPSEGAIIAALKLAGGRSESGIARRISSPGLVDGIHRGEFEIFQPAYRFSERMKIWIPVLDYLPFNSRPENRSRYSDSCFSTETGIVSRTK